MRTLAEISYSMRLKRPSADNTRQWRHYVHCIHGFSEVESPLDYSCNSQLTILCLLAQLSSLCAGLSAICHWVWSCGLEIPGLNCEKVSQNIVNSEASQRLSHTCSPSYSLDLLLSPQTWSSKTSQWTINPTASCYPCKLFIAIKRIQWRNPFLLLALTVLSQHLLWRLPVPLGIGLMGLIAVVSLGDSR